MAFQPNWVSFHNHSIFSMLDGLGKPEDYAERAKELGHPALAITDHGNLHGWLDFYDACNKSGIKPLLGLEGYVARKTRWDTDPEELAGPSEYEWDQRGPYHITLIARNQEGYKNLIKISSYSFLEGYYSKPRLDLELLDKHSNGLIIGSGCLNGILQQALARGDYGYALESAAAMQEMVGRDHFFVEIMDHGLDEQAAVRDDTLRIAKELNAPIMPTGDCHYVNQEDHFHHDLMLCVGTGATVSTEKRFKFNGPEYYLQSYDEMLKRFDPQWLQNTVDMAERVDLQLDFSQNYFPKYPQEKIPAGITSKQYLDDLVWDGLKVRYGEELPEQVVDKSNYELEVVDEMGFNDYFLVVWDLVKFAKDNDIRVGFGRGSAAGCILSYGLQITGLDPIRFGLLFDRFLVRGRKTMPDIDLDFDDRYRMEVIEYARRAYGPERVAHIATFTTAKARTAIKDAGRVLEYDFAFTNKINQMMPPAVLGVTKSIDDSLKASSELRKFYMENEDAKKVIDAARGFEGLVRQPGIHAAGIVITQGPVEDFIPVMRKRKKDGTFGPVVTQWDMDRVDQNGLLKIDFLALRNLGIIDMAVKTERERV